MSIISKKGKQALSDYEYQATLKGWLDRVIMTPFWEAVVSMVPLYIAPNVITVAATVQFIICSLVFQYYTTMNTHTTTSTHMCPPNWCALMMCISLFVYQTLDAIDGKQARRTRQSSPLGQLFDHGNDALSMSPMIFMGMISIQCPIGWQFVVAVFVGYSVFFMINVRARHSGIMYFGVFGVTESQFLEMGVFFITYWFGCDIWRYSIYDIAVLDVNVAVTPFLLVFVSNSIVGVFVAIGEYFAIKEFYAQNATKSDPGLNTELAHFALFLCGCISWSLCGVMQTHLWTYLWICGLIFCGLIHRLIIADVTHQQTEGYYHLLNSLWLMIVAGIYEGWLFKDVSLIPHMSMKSDLMVYSILAYTLIFWAHYVLNVIHELCTILQIRLFVVNPPAKTKKKKKKKSSKKHT